MIDKKKKDPKTVNVPKTDLAFDGAEALDDEDVEKVAGGFGRHAIDTDPFDQIRKNLGGQSGGQSGGTGNGSGGAK